MVSNEMVCPSKEQGSIANTDYPIGARVAFKCAVSLCVYNMHMYVVSKSARFHFKLRHLNPEPSCSQVPSSKYEGRREERAPWG